MSYKNRKKEAIYLNVYKNEDGKETFSPFNLKLVDEKTEDGKDKKTLKRIENTLTRVKAMNRRARRKATSGKNNWKKRNPHSL